MDRERAATADAAADVGGLAARVRVLPTVSFAERVAGGVLRYGLATVLLWIGAMKFTSYEAMGIEPLIANSPLMRWLYQGLSVQGASNLIGGVEILTAVLVAAPFRAPLITAVGGALAAGTFTITLTFLFSTPGWEPSLGGFPGLSAMPGQFLLKDIVLLGAALQVAAHAMSAHVQCELGEASAVRSASHGRSAQRRRAG